MSDAPLATFKLMKNLLKRYRLSPEKLRENRLLKVLGQRLFNTQLWRPRRRSAQRGAAIGLFWTMPPIPLQMLVTAFFCIRFKAHLPIALGLVWVTNPITLVPITLLQYRIGSYLLGFDTQQEQQLEDAMMDTSFFTTLFTIVSEAAALVLPVFCGALVLGTLLAIAGYTLTGAIWRWRLSRRWRARASRHASGV